MKKLFTGIFLLLFASLAIQAQSAKIGKMDLGGQCPTVKNFEADTPATYPNMEQGLMDHFNKKLKFSRKASGSFQVAFVVNADGTICPSYAAGLEDMGVNTADVQKAVQKLEKWTVAKNGANPVAYKIFVKMEVSNGEITSVKLLEYPRH